MKTWERGEIYSNSAISKQLHKMRFIDKHSILSTFNIQGNNHLHVICGEQRKHSEKNNKFKLLGFRTIAVDFFGALGQSFPDRVVFTGEFSYVFAVDF